MFENVDGRRTPDAGVTGILKAHLRAFGSGELKSHISQSVKQSSKFAKFAYYTKGPFTML